MYILYKQDGSIIKTNLTDFIQKGNNNVNKIFLAIEGLNTDEWIPTGYFLLPNNEVVLITAEVAAGNINPEVTEEEIRGKIYAGYEIPILANVTVFEGKVEFSLGIRNLEEQVLFTYKTNITINPSTIVPDETTISVAQYEAILNYINSMLTSLDLDYVKKNPGAPIVTGTFADGIITITDEDIISIFETGGVFLFTYGNCWVFTPINAAMLDLTRYSPIRVSIPVIYNNLGEAKPGILRIEKIDGNIQIRIKDLYGAYQLNVYKL